VAAVERPTVVIISDEPEFSATATRRWLKECQVPSFILLGSSSCSRLRAGDFDLAVIGGLSANSVSAVLESLEPAGKPAIHISRPNGHSPHPGVTVSLPEIPQWPDLLVTFGTQVLALERTRIELAMLGESSAQLEHEATLGRYMLEVRHNLNNALTSILGNSDLILLEEAELSSTMRTQVETIRNMGMRMNEILQRFSSLQKEMQLIQSSRKRATRSATAGA
jgi:signal transduction histidine kinase